MSSDNRPNCQFNNCEADASTTRNHPEFGELQVCSTCATLWGDEE